MSHLTHFNGRDAIETRTTPPSSGPPVSAVTDQWSNVAGPRHKVRDREARTVTTDDSPHRSGPEWTVSARLSE